MEKPEAGRPSPDWRKRSVRLIFEYEERNVKLISAQPVEMIAPPPQAAVPRVGEAGSWIELRDDAGRPLYRRVIDNPVRHDREVVVDDPERPLQRVAVKRAEGSFHLVVPEIAAARSLALKAEAPPRRTGKAAAAEAAEVLEFPLPRGSKEV